MKEKEIRLLAVNPGSRYTGYAVFHGADLVDWGVRSLREAGPKAKARRLESLLAESAGSHDVNCLAVKGLHRARSSKGLRDLADFVNRWGEANVRLVSEHGIDEIEASLIQSGALNKRRLMEEVAARYPFLYPELEREKRNRSPYLVRMFEAVALGMKCFSDLEKSKGRRIS